MKESAIHRSIKTWTDREYPDDVEIIKLTTMGMYGSSGWPDLLILIKPGYAFFMELKAAGGQCTELQLHRHKILRALGFEVYVANDPAVGKGIIRQQVHKAKGGKGKVGLFSYGVNR